MCIRDRHYSNDQKSQYWNRLLRRSLRKVFYQVLKIGFQIAHRIPKKEASDNMFELHRDKFLLKADWKIILQSVPPASFQIQQVHTRKPFLNLEAAGRQTYTETDPC